MDDNDDDNDDDDDDDDNDDSSYVQASCDGNPVVYLYLSLNGFAL